MLVTSRTHPYGTVIPGVVLDVVIRGAAVAVVFGADGAPDAPYLLLRQRGLGGCVAGQRGRITFVRSGPANGYWHFSPAPDPEEGPCPAP